MTGRHALRQMRRVHAAVGATAIAIPASAALADTDDAAASAGPTSRSSSPRSDIGYGQKIVVHGEAPSSEAGQGVSLQFAGAEAGGPTDLADDRPGNDWQAAATSR